MKNNNQYMDIDDQGWLILFLLMIFNPDLTSTINKEYEYQKYEKEYQGSCPQVEWEQDMNASVPFCKITNEPCDLHCLKGDTNVSNPCI